MIFIESSWRIKKILSNQSTRLLASSDVVCYSHYNFLCSIMEAIFSHRLIVEDEHRFYMSTKEYAFNSFIWAYFFLMSSCYALFKIRFQNICMSLVKKLAHKGIVVFFILMLWIVKLFQKIKLTGLTLVKVFKIISQIRLINNEQNDLANYTYQKMISYIKILYSWSCPLLIWFTLFHITM